MTLSDEEIDAVLDRSGLAVPPEDRPMFRDAVRNMRIMCGRVHEMAADLDDYQLFSLRWPDQDKRP